MTIAFLSFLGVIVGASLQYFFTRFLEERKHRQSLKTTAYTDYIRAVSEAAHIALHDERPAVLARLADAKTRICLYGSPEVVAALTEFEHLGGVIGNEQQRATFLKVVKAMRGDSHLQASHLEALLFGENR
jgi:hypothetical protein